MALPRIHFRRSKSIPDTVEVFSIASPNLNSSDPAPSAADSIIKVVFLIQLTKFSDNWYMVFDYRIHAVARPGAFQDFSATNKSGIKFTVTASTPSTPGTSDAATMDLMASHDYDCSLKLASGTRVSMAESNASTISYRQARQQCRNPPPPTPQPDYKLNTDLQPIHDYLTKSPVKSMPIQSMIDLDQPLEALHYKISNTMTLKASPPKLIAFKKDYIQIATATADRFLFYHESIGISRFGYESPFPVFGSITFDDSNQTSQFENEDQQALMTLVGAVFGSWMCDVLNPAAPYKMRVTNLHLIRDSYRNWIMAMGAVGMGVVGI
ncbi:hypothetical protein HDU81_006249 [Chytriomyces hyalinus]|nr:hypothetical protein HDU81_006249 [Chytriomyces hyalinus]